MSKKTFLDEINRILIRYFKGEKLFKSEIKTMFTHPDEFIFAAMFIGDNLACVNQMLNIGPAIKHSIFMMSKFYHKSFPTNTAMRFTTFNPEEKSDVCGMLSVPDQIAQAIEYNSEEIKKTVSNNNKALENIIKRRDTLVNIIKDYKDLVEQQANKIVPRGTIDKKQLIFNRIQVND